MLPTLPAHIPPFNHLHPCNHDANREASYRLKRKILSDSRGRKDGSTPTRTGYGPPPAKKSKTSNKPLFQHMVWSKEGESIQTLVSTHKLTEFNNTAYPKHDDFTPEGKEYCDDSSSPTRKRSRQVSKPSSLDLDLVHSTSSSTSNSGTSSTQASRSPSPSYSPSYGRKSASSFQPSPPQSCPTSPRYSNYTPPSSPNQERKHEAKSQNTTPFAPHYSYQLPQKEPKLSLPTQVTSPPETTRLVVYHITSYKKDTHFTQMVSPHKPLDLDIPHSRRNQMNLDRYPIQHASPKQGPVPYLPSFQSLVAAIPFSYSM